MLLDLRMPAISGLQLLKKLEDLGIRWPAIMITGHGDVEACRRAFKAGVVDFLAKPVDEHLLMETIATCEAALDNLLVCRGNSQLLKHLTSRELEVIELVQGIWKQGHRGRARCVGANRRQSSGEHRNKTRNTGSRRANPHLAHRAPVMQSTPNAIGICCEPAARG